MSGPTFRQHYGFEYDKYEQQMADRLHQMNLLHSEPKCVSCNSTNVVVQNAASLDSPRYRCKDCDKRWALKKNTLFNNKNITPGQILTLIMCWSNRLPQDFVAREIEVSQHIVSEWFSLFRRIIVFTGEEKKIGGPGVKVQLDESLFGKRKANKGRLVDGIWVLCGVESMDKSKAFYKIVPNRKKTTLLSIIAKYVEKGSIICTDEWAGYRGLD
jgi:transposase-like protein